MYRVRALPGTVVFAVCLCLVGLLISRGVINDSVFSRWASTNIANLHRHPVGALVASAFVVSLSGYVNIAITVLACAAVELRAGTRALLTVVVFGQVIPTLFTEGYVRLSIHSGNASRAELFRSDVGLSYVMYAVLAASLCLIPAGWRLIAVAALAGYLTSALLTHRDMTSSGHVLSLMIGLLCWPIVQRRQADLGALLGSPRLIRIVLLTATAAGLVLMDVPLFR